ncbi:MAG: RDD family protein [Acidimicrobiaceae bacterium]|nr:RDD family protein [Acidimicrobiaceae bacterium]MYF44374.1 RDD family protein [Acidimicrobiaceae bacterium]
MRVRFSSSARARPRTVTLRNGVEAPRAGIPERFLARFHDFIIMALIMLAAALLAVAAVVVGLLLGADWNWGDENAQAVVSGLLALAVVGMASLVALLYEPVTTARSGQTIGKRGQQVKVVRYQDGGAAPASRFVTRWAVPTWASTLGWVVAAAIGLPMPYLGMPGLWLLIHLSPLWGRGRRGWHDMIAGTVVVEASWLPPPAGPPAAGP